MKKILLALALMAAAPQIQAKEKVEIPEVLVKEANGKYAYEAVVNVDNVTIDEMFKRAKDWIQQTFKTGDNNIRFDEADYSIINSSTVLFEEGKKGALSYKGGLINFKFVILFKDGKYKFRFDNVVWMIKDISNSPIVYGEPCRCFGKEYYKDKINSIFKSMASELEQSVKGGVKLNNDNW